MKIKILILLFLLINAAIAQNVFVVVIDGARYTETFGYPDPMDLIPNMWNNLMPQGTLYSNFRDTLYTSTNPGHSTILTGTWQTIANNGSERPTKPTVFEYYRKEKSASVNDVFVVAGKEKLNILNYSTDEQYGASYMASVLAEDLTDNEVYDNLTETMDLYHPKLVIVNLPSVDRAGHSNNWEEYLNAIRNADRLVYELWNKIQSDSYYKDNTTLFITNDHGRHTTDFKSHGDDCQGCQHIMLLALGRNIPKANIINSDKYQSDIAASIGDLLKFDTPKSTGSSLFNDSNGEPIKLIIKVYLEGPFNNGKMSTPANISEPKTQNYQKIELTNSGKQFLDRIEATEVIDTVTVELRVDKDLISDINKKGLLLSNGAIVDLDGTNPISFNVIAGKYYIVVKHRNHLSVMSTETVVLPD